MNDLRILENLFEKHDDEIHFELFKRSNIVSINNENQGDHNKEIIFQYKEFSFVKEYIGVFVNSLIIILLNIE